MREEPEGVLARVYREQGPKIWRALMASTGDPEVASDALQEAFAQAASRGDALAAPERWVWKAAFRIAAGEFKNRALLGVPKDSPVEASSDATELMHALSRLPPKQRAALVLHYYCDFKAREIAKIIGCSPATARVHLSAGRKRLKALLEAQDA